MLAVRVSGAFKHVRQGGLLLALGGGASAFSRRGIVLRHLQAVFLRQVGHGFDKAHAGMFHQEADGIAVLAAAEAMKKLLGRADREGWRVFPMERAQPHEVGAAFFELHVAPDDFDNVDASDQFLDE